MPALAAFRATIAPVVRPFRRFDWWPRTRRRWCYLHHGMAGITAELRTAPSGHVSILRQFGATVGHDVSILGPLLIVNAVNSFGHLAIGNGVHIGADTLIDLACPVTIEDYATISMRSTIITHIDVGPGPLKDRRPRAEGPVSIGRGAYLGAGATILHGGSVGAEATIGAHALVDHDVPAGATVASPRARLVAGKVD